jgi:hypothetical protein
VAWGIVMVEGYNWKIDGQVECREETELERALTGVIKRQHELTADLVRQVSSLTAKNAALRNSWPLRFTRWMEGWD